MRNLLRVGGLLLLGGTLLLVGRSWSSTDHQLVAAPGQPPKPKTRVAIVNLTYAIRNYDGFKTLQDEMKATAAPFQVRDQAMKVESEKLAREAADENITIKRRKEIDIRLKQLAGAIQANKTTGDGALKKKNEEHWQILYKDFQDAVTRYAKANDLELVLHYNDASTAAEMDHPQNIAAKVQARACIPLYSAPGVDISKEIAAAMNATLARRKKSM